MKPIAYVASPLGFSEAGRLFHNTVLLPLIIEAGFEIRNPWTLTSAELTDSAQALPYGQKKKEQWSKINSTIGFNNKRAIEEASIIVAILDGIDVDGPVAKLFFKNCFSAKISYFNKNEKNNF